MGYRRAVTPDALIARMSAMLRSVNRSMIVVGAPLGGLIASVATTAAALWSAVGMNWQMTMPILPVSAKADPRRHR
ncbi:hypothetical protein [Arthrobacter sp. ISL-69]|uniref:hypothetical protein n=1 Tax=Arthrobacter sp. ISL-69 TaxID=2819113 RepID=UPI001BE691DA|nr:hypothetical protein [Arthrobacter sp. ISL-69]